MRHKEEWNQRGQQRGDESGNSYRFNGDSITDGSEEVNLQPASLERRRRAENEER
jgi:hypothetical protein